MHTLTKILTILLAITGLSGAYGANISINSLAGGATAKKVVTSSGGNVPVNSIVRVGYFDLTGTGGNTTILTVGLFAALQAIFTPLGEDPGSTADGGRTADGSAEQGPVRFNGAGSIGGSIYNIDNAYMPAGRELYAWVFAQPNADVTATQWTIFRDPSWIMPSGPLGSINLLTSQIDQASEVFRGTLDTASSPMRIIMANIIPEPASALLGLVGLGLAFRRRRA